MTQIFLMFRIACFLVLTIPWRAGAAEAEAIVSGRVTSLADGKPVEGVLVWVRINTGEEDISTRASGKSLAKTTTNKEGRYKMEVSLKDRAQQVWVLGEHTGFLPPSSTYAWESYKSIQLEPGSTVKVDLRLSPASRIAGKVVDLNGKPVPGVQVTATLHDDNGFSYEAELQTDRNGGYSTSCFPLEPLKEGMNGPAKQGQLEFTHPHFVRYVIKNIYDLEKGRRTALNVTLNAGHKVFGVIKTPEGKPAKELMVEVVYEDYALRKATTTDAQGRFALTGLSPGEGTIRALDLKSRQKVKKTIALDKDHLDLALSLKAVTFRQEHTPVNVLGMKLVDLDAELQEYYDLPHKQGVVILDPGSRDPQLEELKEGDCIFDVESKRISSVWELVDCIVASQKMERGGPFGFYVSFRRIDFEGTRGVVLELDPNERIALKARLDEATRVGRWKPPAAQVPAGSSPSVEINGVVPKVRPRDILELSSNPEELANSLARKGWGKFEKIQDPDMYATKSGETMYGIGSVEQFMQRLPGATLSSPLSLKNGTRIITFEFESEAQKESFMKDHRIEKRITISGPLGEEAPPLYEANPATYLVLLVEKTFYACNNDQCGNHYDFRKGKANKKMEKPGFCPECKQDLMEIHTQE